MEIRIEHLNHTKFTASIRGHRLVCGQPASNGGADEGPTPPEFLLFSLGSCAGYYAASYLKNHGIDSALSVCVHAEKLSAPARLGRFRVEIEAPGLPPEHETGMMRTVNACLIKNTLLHSPEIETVLVPALVCA